MFIHKFRFAYVFIVLIFCSGCAQLNVNPSASRSPIKIAIIGDSITYGSGVVHRVQNNYPTQLQRLLGKEYKVKNFGVPGATLLKKGNNPYSQTRQYKDALQFAPDLVYIKLGTNDSKGQNRDWIDDHYESDYKALIQSFQQQNKNTRIVLLLPLPSFSDDKSAIYDPVIKNKIIPVIQKVAFDTQAEVIDLYQLFAGKGQMFPDKIHPTSIGTTIIARRLFKNVVRQVELKTDNTNIYPNNNVTQQNFYGFVQTNFVLNNVDCKIVEPKRIATGRPWLIRARFFGHEPQTDIALLERGFHITYCDVSHLYGNKQALKRWDDLYQLMQNNGFSAKAVLEGMSRGGLIVYNWAAANPSKVAAVYADAPVLDAKSWPGGKGKSEGSLYSWKQFKHAHGLSTAASINDFNEHPIEKTQVIAKAGFPMLHVCGDSDQVVPVDENTRPFERAVKELEGNISTIYKKNVGHHPHSLKSPTRIVDFILRATEQYVSLAPIANGGHEFRSAAGWREGKDWWAQFDEINQVYAQANNIDILLLGDSITQSWGGAREWVTYRPGQKAANKHFNNLNVVNAGIAGDRTENLLWRIENGLLNSQQPKLISLAIGVNNFSSNSAAEIIFAIKKTLTTVQAKFPDSKILLIGPLPTGKKDQSERRIKYHTIHQALSQLNGKGNVEHHDLQSLFIDKNGLLDKELYQPDGTHLKAQGYQVWGEFIRSRYDLIPMNTANN